ncbi:hypothetical protein BDF14DRAFT_1757760 [Spinellus fusiger]|nr:hypothetical protein BDF14DRAFT_1757760 [Spinellus fusiger]
MRSNTKVIMSLINRVAVRLPITTGRNLESLEQDPIVQQTVTAIIELSQHKLSTIANTLGTVLESVSSNYTTITSYEQLPPFDVLQSQLFILRLLSSCMQHQWNCHKDPKLSTSKLSDTSTIKSYETNTIATNEDKQNFNVTEVPPLDEALVTFILVLMTRFLNQVHWIQDTVEHITSSLDCSSDTVTHLDPVIVDITAEIYKATSSVLYYVSASNWVTYYAKIKSAVQTLASIKELSDPIPPELYILESSRLTKQHLHRVLSELSPYFLSMEYQNKIVLSKIMRKAIWHWIEVCPEELTQVCENQDQDQAMQGAQVLFDVCSSTTEQASNKTSLWPLQTLLLVLSPDLLDHAFSEDSSSPNKRSNFLGTLKKALKTPRTADIAAQCYLDFYKASTFLPPTSQSLLHTIVAESREEIKDIVWSFVSTPVSDPSLVSSHHVEYATDTQTLVNEYLLVNLCLHPNYTLQHLIPSCLEEDTPILFKIALAKACLALAQEEHPLPWRPTLSSMYDSLCKVLKQLLLQVIGVEFSTLPKLDLSPQYYTHSVYGQRRTLRKKTVTLAQSQLELLQSLLYLFTRDPLLILLGKESEHLEQNSGFMIGIANLVQHPEDSIRKAAAECLSKLHGISMIEKWSSDLSPVPSFWRISSHIMFTIARYILDCNSDLGPKPLLSLLVSLLSSRNDFLRRHQHSATDGSNIRERLQALVALEIALLVSLSSSNRAICSDAIRSFHHLCVETDLTAEHDTPQLNQITLFCNRSIYTKLSEEGKVFIGRKAQQKIIRKYMRMMTGDTPGVLAAWEETWKRWKVLTSSISRSEDGFEVNNERKNSNSIRSNTTINMVLLQGSMEPEYDKSAEWQNYTGFLAALGGCCLSSGVDYDGKDIQRRTSFSSEPSVQADKFMRDMVDLLVSENVFIRESAKDILGHDLAPALYVLLFKYFEESMDRCFASSRDALAGAQSILFVEQAESVLRLILDRLVDPAECLLIVDFSTLIYQFTKYINEVPSDYVSIRIKIKLCALIEVLMSKKEQIIIRNEVKLRNKLLEITVEWVNEFALDNLPNEKLNRDLDQACLKAIVGILHQLPLQSSESERQLDASQVKYTLFSKYFSFFLKLLNKYHLNEADMGSTFNMRNGKESIEMNSKMDSFPDWTPLKENTILAMSNLLSANIDAGLKYSLAMGYHEDVRIRTAFMQILTNILNQGTEFETLAENIMMDRYEKLVDIVVENNMEVALSLCKVCSSLDASAVAEVLLVCFEARGKISCLLKAVATKEIESTEQEATLLRSTTMSTKILSMFATMTCTEYIRETLEPAMIAINALSDKETTWELDPQKMEPTEDISRNKQNVVRATELLLNAICSSAANAPRAFREELALLVEAVRVRFPESKYMAVSGFVFLRLFSPAILSPENTEFSKQAIPRNKNIHKLQLQATRVMQNLANNVLFGAKETHMTVLNDFLTSNIYKVTSFLREISALPIETSKELVKCSHIEQSIYSKLHCYLFNNLERLSRDFAGQKIKDVVDTQILLDRKKIIDKLSNLLAQLGRPTDISESEFLTNRNYALTNSNHYYSEFIRRNNHRDVTPISALNIFFQGGMSKGRRPVFYLLIRNLDKETCDFELLIYYMLRVMEPFLDHPFELIFDLTYSSNKAEIPAHWLTQFFQLIFNEVNNYLHAMYVFNVNTSFACYIQKLPRLVTDKLLKKAIFVTSLTDLYEFVAPSEIRLPESTLSSEKEQYTVFYSVIKSSHSKSSTTVTVKVGQTYVQIITARKQEIIYNINIHIKDVYHISEFEDMKPTSTPRSENGNDISIKYDHGKASMILSTPKRDALLSLLRYNKQVYESSKPSDENKRAISPSDVPGRLLNMALLNLGSDYYGLRSSAYNLLYALSVTFQFNIGNQLLNAKDLCIPINNTDFIINISEALSNTETHLTLEFINECFVGFNQSNETIRQMCLDYVSPWLKNLCLFYRAPNDCKKIKSKVNDVLKLLIEMTVKQVDIYKHVQAKVWKTLTQVEDMINPILDAFIQYSVENGVGSPQAEAMADTFVTMTSVVVRGKVINRMRKVIQFTSMHPCKNLTEHSVWPEIAVLLRFALMLSFNCSGCIKPYLPEAFHIISILAATGPTFIRASVHEFVVNTIHTLCTGTEIREASSKKLQFLLIDICENRNRIHFGLAKNHAKAFTITQETLRDISEPTNLSSIESIVYLLLETMNVGAPSTDIANMWRARWMSLVTSTAFQFNPAIQPRSFVILGCLAQEEVDDDLLYQILVALRGALAIFNKIDSSLIVSILMCLKNIIGSIPADSRYLLSLFWLAIALVQMGSAPIFTMAVEFLRSVLLALDAHHFFENFGLVEILLRAREPIADIARELDGISGVSFENHFSFALVSILLRGSKLCDPEDRVYQCLTTFLEVDCKNSLERDVVEARALGYLAGLLPIAAKNNVLSELLRLAGIGDVTMDSIKAGSDYVKVFDALEIPDNTTALLLVSLLANMLRSAENEAERLFLYGFLAESAISIPEVFSLVYESLLPKMNQIVVSSQNYAVIDAVKCILTTVCSEPAFNHSQDRISQKVYLEELGFPILADPTFGAVKINVAINAKLVSRLLERITE